MKNYFLLKFDPTKDTLTEGEYGSNFERKYFFIKSNGFGTTFYADLLVFFDEKLFVLKISKYYIYFTTRMKK